MESEQDERKISQALNKLRNIKYKSSAFFQRLMSNFWPKQNEWLEKFGTTEIEVNLLFEAFQRSYGEAKTHEVKAALIELAKASGADVLAFESQLLRDKQQYADKKREQEEQLSKERIENEEREIRNAGRERKTPRTISLNALLRRGIDFYVEE